MGGKKILVVDDRKNTLKVISAILTDEGYDVIQAENGRIAIDHLNENPEINAILSDLKMPGMDGIELFYQIKDMRHPPPFIIMTAHGTVKSAVQAMRKGVANYLIKPLDYEELVIVLDKAIREYEMSRELVTLRKQIQEENSFHGIVGANKEMRDIFEIIRTVSKTDASVLIYGETGTGKELLAKAIHKESQRNKSEMVCINSAALTESLLEAELFGYVKGAFTGAAEDHKGRIEMAAGGTLFLDEIGYMTTKLQTKLLRFLQEMTFNPVGDSKPRKVDVRIITATNFNLQEEILTGNFLRDLFYRLEVISIKVPPLRNRRDDIPLLVDHYIKHYVRQYNKPIDGIEPSAMEHLINYDWPGNIRELTNCIARMVILSKNINLRAEDLPKKTLMNENSPSTSKGIIHSLPDNGYTLKDVEFEIIEKTLKKCNGNKSLAARYLGISRKTLYEKIERYKINI